MPRSRELVRITTTRGGSRAPELRTVGGRAQKTVNDEMRDLGRIIHGPFVAAAPRKRGRLRKSIRARVSFRGGIVRVTVGANARSRRGFEYTNVTRFGHRRAVIYPRRKSRLVFSYMGRRHVVMSVKGYRPSRDWVLDGIVVATPMIDRSQQRLERALEIELRDGILR